MVYRDDEGNYRNSAGWKVSAPDNEPTEKEQERSKRHASDNNDGNTPGVSDSSDSGGSSSSSSSSGTDYPNPLEGDEPAEPKDAGKDLGNSITEEDRDKLQELKNEEDAKRRYVERVTDEGGRNLEQNPGDARELGLTRDVVILEDEFLDENPEFEEPGRKDEYSINYDPVTGRLSVETTDEYERRKRRELTQRIINDSPAQSPEDVVIRETQNGFKASFSEEFQSDREGQIRDSLRQEFISETEANSPDDVVIRETQGGFEASFSEAFQSEQRAEAELDLAQRVLDETRADSVDDFTIRETDDGGLVAEFTEEFQKEGTVDLDLSADLSAGRETQDRGERFGDVVIPIGDTNLEAILDDKAQGYNEFVGDLSEANRKYNPGLAAQRAVYDAVDPYIGGDNILENPESGRLRSEEFAVGAGEGAAQLANVPATAAGLKEGVEFVGFAAGETVLGRGGETASATRDAAATAVSEGVDAVAEEPGRNTGMLVGSLATSVGVLGGAARLSPRVGRAARYSIQPGEEIISDGATFALRSKTANRLTRGRADSVVDKFPGGRIDNEEILIKAGQRATSKLSRSIGRARYDIGAKLSRRQGSFIRDSRGSLDFSRPSSRSIETESYEPPEDLLDDSLTQSQDYLGATARRELDAQRGQLDDVGRTGGGLPDEGGRQDRLTFDPLQAEERLRRAREASPQRPRAAPQDSGRVQWGRLGELERGDRRASRRSSFVSVETEREAESGRFGEIAAEGRPETLLDDGLLDRAEASSFGPRSRDPLGRSDVATGVESPGVEPFSPSIEAFSELDLEAELETELEAELETEAERELESEYESEFETELESELESLLETELESELEAELELESEFERESEAKARRRRQEEIQSQLLAIDGAGKSWRSSIADVDDLLGGSGGWF